MQLDELKKLRYRRQYILSPGPLSCNFLHNTFSLDGSLTLYAHIDLNVTQFSSHGIKLTLLGDLFDYEHTRKNNEDLLRDIIDPDLSVILTRISRYAGRFVLIYCTEGNVYLLTDAAAARKVYYCRKEGEIYCASQPHLLASSLNLEYTKDPSKLQFYQSCEFTKLNNSNIGNTTCYDEVFQLIPNHFFDYYNYRAIRFWPDQKIEKLSLDKVTDICSNMVKGYIKSIGSRYKIMLPVTGGKDSRLLFSATYDFKEDVYYYINKESRMASDSYDITIPQSLLSKLNVDFHILDPYPEIPEEFRKTYYENDPHGSEAYLPIIYNYYLNFSDRINLPGTFVNIIEDLYEVHGRNISGKVLADLIHVENFDYAESYYTSWLENCRDLCASCDLNVLNLLYWEERMANWGTQIQLNKDIAQEDIIPYNSRLLIQTMLSAELKFREKPDFIIFREIIRKLWPEALQAPFNPDIKFSVLKISKVLGIMKIVKSIYYRFFH